jgi:hypothetical protein
MAARSVILIEFNELCPSLMQRFMSAGNLPNFRRFHDEAQVYVTEAEERPPYLEPWIQWITVHAGLTYREHQVFNLGEAHRVEHKFLWDVLSDAGLRVWVCGAMNARYQRPLNGRLLPDPWATEIAPYPDDFAPYFKFIQHHVTEYTNQRARLSPKDYANFVWYMARHGLAGATVRQVVAQLASERAGKNRWKRAIILDQLQLDLFRHYQRELRPQFSIFFSNSTAHFQHMYWRNMEPELFGQKPSLVEQAEYQDAIRFGYQNMDHMLGQFIELCGPDTTLIFLTALSQQPCLLYEETGGKVWHRPKDFAALLRFAGVPEPFSVAPVMSHYFHVYFDRAEDARAAAEKLRALHVGGEQALHVDDNGASLFCGCRLYQPLPETTLLESRAGASSGRFFDLFYQVEGVKSGMHHPDGMLWIRTPERAHRVHSDKVPLPQIAPMILDMFSVPKPTSMAGAPLAGFSRLCAAL